MTSERRSITQPADWWEAFEEAAKAEGTTLSEWIGACCVANVPVPVAERLSKRPAVGAPKKAKDESK